MESDHTTGEPSPAKPSRAAGNLVAFLVTFGFVWLVFDNMALGLIFGLMVAGVSEAAQRASRGKKS